MSLAFLGLGSRDSGKAERGDKTRDLTALWEKSAVAASPPPSETTARVTHWKDFDCKKERRFNEWLKPAEQVE